MLELLLSLLLALLALLWLRIGMLPAHYPATPPFRLPLIGHLPYLLGFANIKVAISHICRKYGRDGMVALHVGTYRWVFIYDLGLLREAFKKEQLNYRCRTPAVVSLMAAMRGCSGPKGMIFSYERAWTEQRRFTLRHLKDLGFGKASMETLIVEELTMFMDYLHQELRANGGCLDMLQVFNVSIINVLWKITSGRRYDYQDPELHRLTTLVNDTLMSGGPKLDPMLILPALRWILPRRWDLLIQNKQRFSAIRQFIEQIAEELRSGTQAEGEPQNLIDAFLRQIQAETDPESSFYQDKGWENMTQVLMDLFFAGSDTTSSALTWAILFLVRNPQVQDRMREEIMAVVGEERRPSLADKTKMPYCQAAILEVQRLGDIAPFGSPHANFSDDVWLAGARIPKGHTVYPLLSMIMNQGHEADADQFRPERHLERRDGRLQLRADPCMIPFSVGKRQCPGETLAKAELFLYITFLLQTFRFAPLDPDHLPELDCDVGITCVPRPFRVTLQPRNMERIA